MKYAWINEMAGKQLWWFSVALACDLLGVSRSGFYDWRARRGAPASAYQREQQVLLAAIVVAHRSSGRRYGSPRIHADLVEAGWQVGVNRVARLMRTHGIAGRSGRIRRHHLTRQAKVQPEIPDLMKQHSPPRRPTALGSRTSPPATRRGWLLPRGRHRPVSAAVVGLRAATTACGSTCS